MVIERGRTLQNVGVSIAGHASRKPWNVYSSPPLDEAEPADVQRGVADKPVAARANRARRRLDRAPGALPRRPAPPAGAPRGSPDQPTHDPVPLPESSNPRPLPLADAGAFA